MLIAESIDGMSRNYSFVGVCTRERCIQMLTVLADTLDQEYLSGGRAHWGSEDRCATSSCSLLL